jgi:hypothetical protein
MDLHGRHILSRQRCLRRDGHLECEKYPMPDRLSAVDSVSPAFADTRRILFASRSFAMWSRMAILCLLMGEFSTGGGSGGFNLPESNRSFYRSLINTGVFDSLPKLLRENWIWIVSCTILLVALFFIAEYLSSVSRFVLLESVITGKCEFRESWKKWQGKGLKYFAWDVGFTVCCIIVLILLLGIPLWTAVKKMSFSSSPNFAALLAGGAVVLLAVGVFLVIAAVIDLLARDFLVPIMAVENRGVWSGWRRLLPMLAAEKLANTGYILMKTVLSIGSAILFGIIDLVALLLLLIPLGLIGVLVYLSLRGVNLPWNFTTVSVTIILAALLVAVILWLFAFLYSPALVFFQSYALRFLASRLPSLSTAMNSGALEPVRAPNSPSS